MTEVDFASNEIWRGLPLMLGGVADFKLDFWCLRFLKFLSFIQGLGVREVRGKGVRGERYDLWV